MGDYIEVNKAICDALGLNVEELRSLTITLQRGDFPLVEAVVRAHPRADALEDTLRRFTLVPAEDESDG